MYEYHGWATLRESYVNEDHFDGRSADMIAKIHAEADRIGADNGLLDLRAVNGEYQLHLSGLLNRKSARAEEIIGFFRFIASEAPGSYGLLYVFDDEDKNGEDNEFQVYVLAKGSVCKKKYALLSPFCPVVEE